MRPAHALLIAGLLACCCAYGATPAEPFVRSSQYVTSGDGTRLAIDIYRPARNGALATEKVPVIVMQARSELRREDPARGSPRMLSVVRAFTAQGYALVAQDRRGTGASFGTQRGFINRDDGADAKAVIDWAGTQAWSTGKVGAVGCSNQGGWQYVVLAEAPKHLVAIAPECASPMFFDDMISQNGVSSFAAGDRPAYAGECGPATPPGAPVDEDLDGSLARAAAEERRCNAPFLGQYTANMHRDTYNATLKYAPGMIDSVAMRAAAAKRSKVRILHMAAWFDPGPGGQLQGWQIFGGRALVGPWIHCGNADPGGPFPDASIDKLAYQLRWFDTTLKGIDTGLDREPPIRYYTMYAPAGTEWRNAARWPLPEQRATEYFLAAGPSGSIDSRNDGVLGLTRPGPGTDRDTYRPDYSAALFDGRFESLARFWTGDLRAGIDRKALTYTLPVLGQDLQVTGHPVVKLWVTSTAPDQDFFAILEDVALDGSARYVTDGKIRGSRRATGKPPWGDLGTPWHPQLQKHDQPLSAQPAQLHFSMTPTSWVFRAGHRVRLSIVNSVGRGYQSPPGVDRSNPPELAVLRDRRHASSLVLPVIPTG